MAQRIEKGARQKGLTPGVSILALGILLNVLWGCVPLKELEKVQTHANQLQDSLNQSEEALEQLRLRHDEQQARIAHLSKINNNLTHDTLQLRIAKLRAEEECARLRNDLATLESLQRSLVESTQSETTRLLEEIQHTQEALRERELALKELERTHYQRKLALDNLSRRIQADSLTTDSLLRLQQTLTQELQTKHADMEQLRLQLNQKDSMTQALRQSVADALFGFEGQGLTVNLRNGRVYVSLDEQLMFKSGNYQVDATGREALQRLIPVLAQQTDVEIVVEGHTDDVPLHSSSAISDNWDLSVKRATSIVRELLKGNQIDPSRITASGRAEYHPLVKGSTPEARRQNRRTEIILQPRVSHILQALEK